MHIVKVMIFPVVIYGFEHCTIQNAEQWRIDAFTLLGWRRFLRVPWTARWPNQIILKEINPEYSLEGLMLRLKPRYFGHLMQRADALETTLMLGKIEGRRRLTKDDTILEWHHWFSGCDSSGCFLMAQRVKNLPVMQEPQKTWVQIPALGRFPGGGNDNPLQHSCLENPMDRGAWQATVQRVTKSQTRQSTWAQGESRWVSKSSYIRVRGKS